MPQKEGYGTTEVEYVLELVKMKKIIIYLLMLIVCSFNILGTTIKINNTISGILADISLFDGEYIKSSLQYKINISSVPSTSSIDSSILCNYWRSGDCTGLSNTDATIDRVRNQTWIEGSISFTDLTDNRTTTDKWSNITVLNWGCINVTKQVTADFSDSNNFTSIRIYDSDNIFALVYAEDANQLGGLLTGCLVSENRENVGSTGNTPYLNITYTEPPTKPKRSQSFFIKQISRFIIKSTGRFYMKK